MKLEKVQSSSLSSVGYDDSTNTLAVEFVNRSLYFYAGVPRKVYDDLLAAESKGSYFSKEIRPSYLYFLLEESEIFPKGASDTLISALEMIHTQVVSTATSMGYGKVEEASSP